MKNPKSNGIVAIGAVIMFALVLGLILTGCATTVPIKSVRQPTIDTSKIQRLAIKPFEDKSGVGGQVAAQLTRYLTEESTRIIRAAGKFDIVAPTDPNAEGIFTGEIRNIGSEDSQQNVTRTRKDSNGNTEQYVVTVYTRKVSLEFSYSVISSRDQMPIGDVIKKDSISRSAENSPSSLPSVSSLVEQMAGRLLRSLEQDVVPTIVSTNRKLMKETSKDKVVKQKMKDVLALVKNNNYEEAIRQYEAIYKEHNSGAAQTNATILREAIASDIAATAELKALFDDKDGLAEKAAKGAVEALNSELPAGATISIMTGSTIQGQGNMLEYIVEQMTKAVLQESNLQIAERSSNMALIDAEKQYQLSGNVDDNAIVSIGHELGVQYMVICSITGEMSRRRLSLKVLNVETGGIIVQNDFEV